MKKGDVVVIEDSSYSKIVTVNGLKKGYNIVRKKQGIVIEVDCKFPNPHENQQHYGNRFNNTIIITDSGKIVFIEERFLRLVEPTHKVMVDIVPFSDAPAVLCGKIIEISDKFYKEIKKSQE